MNSEEAIAEETARIVCEDGAPLAATIFLPQDMAGQRPVTIVAAATAVERRFYARFARFLAENGRPVVTFDYRGIGGSLVGDIKHCKAEYREWGTKDAPAVLAFVAERFPGRPIHWVGHSYGGFAPGMAHNNHLVKRLLGVATMSADIRLLEPSFELVRIVALLTFVGPTLAHTLGYVPGGVAGNTPLPKGVLLGWSKWCRTRGFLFGDLTLDEVRHFKTLTAPVRLTLIEDDKWVSRKGVEHLLEQFSVSENRSIWDIPAREGAPAIGHVGFFRPEHRDPLWRDALAWLDQDL
jgi:predicted alpha/beta hydrolase